MARMTQEEKREHLINCMYDKPGGAGFNYAIINRFIIPDVYRELEKMYVEGIINYRCLPNLGGHCYWLKKKEQVRIQKERKVKAIERINQFLDENPGVDETGPAKLVLLDHRITDAELDRALKKLDAAKLELNITHALIRNLFGTIKPVPDMEQK